MKKITMATPGHTQPTTNDLNRAVWFIDSVAYVDDGHPFLRHAARHPDGYTLEQVAAAPAEYTAAVQAWRAALAAGQDLNLSPLRDAAGDPNYTPPACPIPGTHSALEQTGLATPFRQVCRSHLDAAVLSLGTPAPQPIRICTPCAAGDPRTNPYGVVRGWPSHTFQRAEAHQVLTCADHLTDALTALI